MDEHPDGGAHDRRATELDVGEPKLAGTRQVCQLALRLLPVDGAAVAVITDLGSRELVHSTDAVMLQLDELQFNLGEGPCWDAFHTGQPVGEPDMFGDEAAGRWPGFARGAQQAGAAAVFAFPLSGGPVVFGVLELYRRIPGDLAEPELAKASTLARTASGLVLTDLVGGAGNTMGTVHPHALLGRREVHQASGMVAVQLKVTLSEALVRLRATAFAQQRPLIDVARDILARRLNLEDDRS